MVNPLNFGIFAGNLAADPKVFDNSDGSRTVKLTVYALDNYRKRDGSRGSQRIQFDRFIEAGQDLGIYQYLTTGMAVAINYTLKSNSYIDKNTGKKVWTEFQSINSITPNESKTVSDERRARNAAANQGAQAQANQNAPAPQNQQFNQGALDQHFQQQFGHEQFGQGTPVQQHFQQQFGQPAQAPATAPVQNQQQPQPQANQFGGAPVANDPWNTAADGAVVQELFGNSPY